MRRYYQTKDDLPLDATPFHNMALYAVGGMLLFTTALTVVDASGYTPYLEKKVVESIGSFVVKQ